MSKNVSLQCGDDGGLGSFLQWSKWKIMSLVARCVFPFLRREDTPSLWRGRRLPDFLGADCSLWRSDMFPTLTLWRVWCIIIPCNQLAVIWCLPCIETMFASSCGDDASSMTILPWEVMSPVLQAGHRQGLQCWKETVSFTHGGNAFPASMHRAGCGFMSLEEVYPQRHGRWWFVEGETRSPLVKRQEMVFGETQCVEVLKWCFGERMSLRVSVAREMMCPLPASIYAKCWSHPHTELCNNPQHEHPLWSQKPVGLENSARKLVRRAWSRPPRLAKAYINRLTFALAPLKQYGKVLKLHDVVSYPLAYNQNLELLVCLHTLHIDLICTAIQPQVPPWGCSWLNPNNSLVHHQQNNITLVWTCGPGKVQK